MNHSQHHTTALIVLATLLAISPLTTSVAAPGTSTSGTLSLSPATSNSLLDDRVARLERIMENQSASTLTLQMQQIQQEIQELRGLIESQQLDVQKLQRQLRDQYLDIDSRLGKGQDTPTSGSPVSGTEGQPPIGTEGGTPTDPANGVVDVSGTGLKPAVASETQPPVTAPTPATPGAVGIPSLPSPETMGGNERDAYRDAFELLKQRKYPAAVNAFNEVLRHFPQGQFTDNARYWLAEAYYVQRNYPAALAEFDRLVQLHPTSARVPAALLKIGDIQSEQDARDQARNAYKQVISRFPGSTESQLAQKRLGKLQK
jgi:tol-pal system protein YbgF